MTARVLRTLAIAIVVAALIDPAVRVTRAAPIVVRLVARDDDPQAQEVRARMTDALGDRVQLTSSPDAAAVVIVGRDTGVVQRAMTETRVPISVVALEGAIDLAIAAAPPSIEVHEGQGFSIPVEIEARGVAGKPSIVALEDRGVEVARVEHHWTTDGRAAVALPYVATTGLGALTVRVHELPGETKSSNNRADVRVSIRHRPYTIAVVEPRPSWPAAFVRRALEDDDTFRVSAIVHVSRGIATRTGEPPRALTASQLMPFDAVLVGAPEDLREGDVAALREFADVRGGAVVLLPDRKPSGPYSKLLAQAVGAKNAEVTGTEQLLQQPRILAPAPLRASELVSMPRETLAEVHAAVDGVPVIVSWPLGDGRLIYSGALDAWRFRADPKAGFEPFWRALVGHAAAAAPAALQLSVVPAVIRPDGRARLVIRLRRTEIPRENADGVVQLPGVSAQLVAPDGRVQMIRPWPGAELGTFEADVDVARAPFYTIRAVTASGASADTVLAIEASAAAPETSASSLEGIAALTGGVSARADDLGPLVEHLATLPQRDEKTTVHPMRTGWWMAMLAAALCGEWAMRRRRGLA
jgi:hypothetical protein